ncbi:hypothetical protein VaNZ11_011035, partial [Volvox africanus]
RCIWGNLQCVLATDAGALEQSAMCAVGKNTRRCIWGNLQCVLATDAGALEQSAMCAVGKNTRRCIWGNLQCVLATDAARGPRHILPCFPRAVEGGVRVLAHISRALVLELVLVLDAALRRGWQWMATTTRMATT